MTALPHAAIVVSDLVTCFVDVSHLATMPTGLNFRPAAAVTNASSASSAAPAPSSLSEKQLLTKSMGELRALAAQRGIRGGTKAELVKELLKV